MKTVGTTVTKTTDLSYLEKGKHDYDPKNM